ncbi:radical SAM protein [Patescibacteria group bacterium]|nr:radical SAM protein [Patescibacteria group bacterium]
MKQATNPLYLEHTISICPKCIKRVPAKIVQDGESIYLIKYCKDHGEQKELFEEDARYYFKKKLYDKPGTDCKRQTEFNQGCPFDCGLCPDHEQHTCIGLIEVTEQCNLRCPSCYASSGEGKHLSLEKIEEMMDFYIDSEYEQAEILQISGGEPTIHPQILDILKLAKNKDFKYVMLNTNGLRLSEDLEFADAIAHIFQGTGFEIYLQFDGLEQNTYQTLRGSDLRLVKQKAIDNLISRDIPITLVSTILKGVNDHEVGAIVDFGLKTKGIRGLNMQPLAFFGRLDDHIDTTDRITLSGILKRIEEQTNGKILFDDFVPLPCNVDRVAITYLTNRRGKWMPLARGKDLQSLVPRIKNTFAFSLDDAMEEDGSCCGTTCKCFGPKKLADVLGGIAKSASDKKRSEYLNKDLFRISVTSFIDVYNFDMKSMKKECVHIITEDLRKIPFSSYNMFHRPGIS